MTSCYMCGKEVIGICSKCGQPYCTDHKALIIGSICLQCHRKQVKRTHRIILIPFLTVVIIIPLISLIMLLINI